MKKNSALFFIIGLCAFVSFMCSGTIWLFDLLKISWAFLSTLRLVANTVLIVSAFVAGFVWLSSLKINKTFKIVLQVIFIIFAVLTI